MFVGKREQDVLNVCVCWLHIE